MKHMMSGMDRILGAWFCVVMSVALLLHSFRLSLEGAAGGVVAMGKKAGR